MPMPKLTNLQTGTRKSAARRVQIKRLEVRLGWIVLAAEAVKPGTLERRVHLAVAEVIRQKLKKTGF
jgi:hypothetical protein